MRPTYRSYPCGQEHIPLLGQLAGGLNLFQASCQHSLFALLSPLSLQAQWHTRLTCMFVTGSCTTNICTAQAMV
jgi:hypothetical protein